MHLLLSLYLFLMSLLSHEIEKLSTILGRLRGILAGEFPSQRANNLEIAYVICSWSAHTVEQTVDLPVNSDALSLVWRHPNVESFYCKICGLNNGRAVHSFIHYSKNCLPNELPAVKSRRRHNRRPAFFVYISWNQKHIYVTASLVVLIFMVSFVIIHLWVSWRRGINLVEGWGLLKLHSLNSL